MKHYRIAYYILVLSFIWVSCDKDDVDPKIEIVSPHLSASFLNIDTLHLVVTISDDIELDYVKITYTDIAGTTESTVELEGASQTYATSFPLDFKNGGILKIKVEAFDKAGNTASTTRNYDYIYFDSGTIDFNIKLQYKDQPLVIFEPYEYPDGRELNFTRCSFYTSEMKLDETMINEVEFHNLTNSHSTSDFANQGYNWSIKNVPIGSYSELSFNIGVPTELNSMDPGEFPSGHPLAKPAENWFSWNSYIFLKIEGKIDLDDDGEIEKSIALHLGSDEALRQLRMDQSITINKDEKTEINIIFDVYKLFDGQDRIYPIDDNPQIHNLDQIDAVIELSNNLINSIIEA